MTLFIIGLLLFFSVSCVMIAFYIWTKDIIKYFFRGVNNEDYK